MVLLCRLHGKVTGMKRRCAGIVIINSQVVAVSWVFGELIFASLVDNNSINAPDYLLFAGHIP